jgi:hypothetical protein
MPGPDLTPVLQAEDGSFLGWGWNDDGQYMAAFDQTGNVRWAVSGDLPQIATADGGVIGQSGIVYSQKRRRRTSKQPTHTILVGASYSVDGGGLSQTVATPIQWASSFQSVPGGNPSGTPTAVPFLTWREGMAFWGLGRGPSCQIGSSKVPLSGTILQQYNGLKQDLLTGGYLTCPACSTFFNEIRQGRVTLASYERRHQANSKRRNADNAQYV